MKILLTTILVSIISFVNANELDKKQEYDYPYKNFYQIKTFINDSGKQIGFDLATKLNTDLNWLKGNEYLTQQRYKADTTNPVISKHVASKNYNSKGELIGTSEFLERYKGSRKFLANYTVSKTIAEKALKEFNTSVNNTGNPLAAHQGLGILYDYFDNDSKLKKLYKKKFAEVLMQNDICWGYLVLGQMYEKGEYVTKDKKYALKIYEQGKPTCKRDVFKSWQHKHLLSGYYGLKRYVK